MANLKTKMLFLFNAFLFFFLLFSCGSDDESENPIPEPPITQEEYPKKSGVIRILSYNVRHFENSSGKIDYNSVAEIIKKMDADVVCLQEIDKNTNRSKGKDQMEEIALLTNMKYYFSKSIDFQGGEYGNGILSKEKALNTEIISLPGEQENRSALVVEFDDFVVISTHLALQSYNREQSIKLLSADAAKYKDKIVFMAGDFNEENFNSPFFQELRKYWNIDSANKYTYKSSTSNSTARIDYILSFKKQGLEKEISSADVVYNLKDVNVSSVSDHFPLFCDYKFN